MIMTTGVSKTKRKERRKEGKKERRKEKWRGMILE